MSARMRECVNAEILTTFYKNCFCRTGRRGPAYAKATAAKRRRSKDTLNQSVNRSLCHSVLAY
jgi:hypothetical protein